MKNLWKLSVLRRYLYVCFNRPGLVHAVRAAMDEWRTPFGDIPSLPQRVSAEGGAPTTEDFAGELTHKQAGPTT